MFLTIKAKIYSGDLENEYFDLDNESREFQNEFVTLKNKP